MPTEIAIGAPKDCAPPLTPKMAPWMRRVVKTPHVVKALVEKYGSPVHVVEKFEFARNANDLMEPLKSRKVFGGLFFARKANKLPWFVTAARDNGLGVDTASLNEVRQTLQLGVEPQKIVVTAIGKTPQLISLAINEGCLLVVDNEDELNMIRSTAGSSAKAARIGLRFSGFELNGRKVFSRFGFPLKDAGQLLSSVLDNKHLQLHFLHAHLDRYDTDERAEAARQLIAIADRARSSGHSIDNIDLGGGILIRYLESREQWEEFQHSLLSAVKGERSAFTYLNDGLGYVRAGGEIAGQPDLYPAWNNLSKERFIAAVLDNSANGTALHKELSGRGMNLFFEPGRALLDNAGMTFATVMFRKRDTLGNLIIGCAMNRTNLRPFRAEFCSDPILLSDGARSELTEGAYIVGCLCGEGDIIFRRKLQLARLPEPGDILGFANTAGYLAHHMEIGTHGDPLPANVLIDATSWNVEDVISPNALSDIDERRQTEGAKSARANSWSAESAAPIKRDDAHIKRDDAHIERQDGQARQPS